MGVWWVCVGFVSVAGLCLCGSGLLRVSVLSGGSFDFYYACCGCCVVGGLGVA